MKWRTTENFSSYHIRIHSRKNISALYGTWSPATEKSWRSLYWRIRCYCL